MPALLKRSIFAGVFVCFFILTPQMKALGSPGKELSDSTTLPVYKPGDTVKLGKPAQDRRNFSYITYSPYISATSSGNEGISRNYAFRELIVKKVVYKNGVCFLVCKSAEVLNYWINLEAAISSGEIIIKKGAG